MAGAFLGSAFLPSAFLTDESYGETSHGFTSAVDWASGPAHSPPAYAPSVGRGRIVIALGLGIDGRGRSYRRARGSGVVLLPGLGVTGYGAFFDQVAADEEFLRMVAELA